MSQLIHAVARIRAMESELLTQNSANRMISASSFESAYAVLDELGYAKESSVFRDTYNYEGAIEAGLFQTSQIFKAFEIKSIQKILTVVFDIQNIILYIKALDKSDKDTDNVEVDKKDKKNLVDSSEIISYGYYSKAVLDNAFFNNSTSSEYSELLTLIRKINNCETLFEKEELVEEEIFKSATKEAGKNKFLISFLNKIKYSQELKKEILIDSKEVLLKRYKNCSTLQKILSSVFAYTSKQEQIFALEILLDEAMVEFLKKESAGTIDGYEVLFSFFWRKERNARVIRSILLAKKSGISPESIKAEFDAFIF